MFPAAVAENHRRVSSALMLRRKSQKGVGIAGIVADDGLARVLAIPNRIADTDDSRQREHSDVLGMGIADEKDQCRQTRKIKSDHRDNGTGVELCRASFPARLMPPHRGSKTKQEKDKDAAYEDEIAGDGNVARSMLQLRGCTEKRKDLIRKLRHRHQDQPDPDHEIKFLDRVHVPPYSGMLSC